MNISISKDIYDTVSQHGNDYYLYVNGEFISNPEYSKRIEGEAYETRIEEIKTELEEIDKVSQRASRAIALCYVLGETPNPDDCEKLAEFENRAKELREELQELETKTAISQF